MSKRGNRGSMTPVKAAALGIGLSLLLLALTAAVGSLLVGKEALPEESCGTIAAAAAFLACLLGPVPLVRCAGKGMLPAACMQTGAFLVILALVKLTVWPGDAYGNWAVLAAAPAGAVLCGILSAKRSRRRR